MQQIQWYPGHMTKAMRMMEKEIKLTNNKGEAISALEKYKNEKIITKAFDVSRAKVEAENIYLGVKGKEVEKLLKMTRFTTEEAANRFAMKLRKMGIDDKLRELGAEDGDNVRILDFEFDYKL